MLRDMFIHCIFVCIFLPIVETTCQFPSDLRGHDWYTTSNGKVSIPSDGSTITNFMSAVKSGQLLTLTCTTYDNDTDRYISTTNIAVFSSTPNLKVFFCMKFTKLTTVKYVMTYDTDIDVTTLTRVVVINNITGTLTPSQACSLTSSQPVGTQELLVRADSVSSSVITCPSSLRFNLTATVETSDCTGTSILGSNLTTQHVYTYASCVTKKYTSSRIYDCMYSVISEPYTYLTVFNNDSTVDESTTYRALCYVIWSSGNVIYYTYHPKICQVSQTPIVPDTDGAAVVAINNLSNDVGKQIAVGVIFGLLFLFILVLTIVFFVLYIRGPRVHKAVRIIEPKQEKSSKTKSNSSNIKQNKEEKKKKEKKAHKKKKRIKDFKDQNQNFHMRRTESFWENEQKKSLKWTDVVGISANVHDFNKPAWQLKWEQHVDPLWEKRISYDANSETARSSDSTASSSKIIWVMPEKEEQERSKSIWEKVYHLWYEPRKPENRLQEMQKLANLAKPKRVHFRGDPDKK